MHAYQVSMLKTLKSLISTIFFFHSCFYILKPYEPDPECLTCSEISFPGSRSKVPRSRNLKPSSGLLIKYRFRKIHDSRSTWTAHLCANAFIVTHLVLQASIRVSHMSADSERCPTAVALVCLLAGRGT